MNKTVKLITTVMLFAVAMGIFFIPVKTQAAETSTAVEAETNENDVTVMKAIASAIVVGAAAAAGAIGMSKAISKATEGVARQPEAAGKIQSLLMLGLVFIETAIIYALVVVVFIVFIL